MISTSRVLENIVSGIVAAGVALVVLFAIHNSDVLRANILGGLPTTTTNIKSENTTATANEAHVRTTYSDGSLILYPGSPLPSDATDIHIIVAHNDTTYMFLDYESIYDISYGDYTGGVQHLMLSRPHTSTQRNTTVPLLTIGIEGSGGPSDVTIGSVSYTTGTKNNDVQPTYMPLAIKHIPSP